MTDLVTADRLIRLARCMGGDVRARMQDLARALSTQVQPLVRLSETLRAACNDPVTVAGLEGRYFVTAAVDPDLADPESRDALIHAILGGHPTDDRLLLLTAENRGRVAAAVVSGWVTRPGCCCPRPGEWSHRCPEARHRHYAELVA